MKILLGYSYYRYPFDISKWVETWLKRLRLAGIDVHGFPLTLDPPGPRLSWPDLEARWKRGDNKLLTLYSKLAQTLEDYDVFVNWNGINLYPDFVKQLPTFNVYGCFDDPESSEDLSKPVAWAYDLCMIGNVAELETYLKWGVKEVRFWPLGFRSDDFSPSLTKDKILNGERDIDIALLCERESGWRAKRLDEISVAFPNGAFFGKGWPKGFLPNDERIPLYQRTKIGPNFHNSTGPINFRTYILPANGVMQLCDNKSHLAKIFELDREVIGFDTIEEAIDLAHYYISHDDERRQVAAAGWERAVNDYNEVSVFKLVEKYVNEVKSKRQVSKNTHDTIMMLHEHRRSTTSKRLFFLLYNSLVFLKKTISKSIRKLI